MNAFYITLTFNFKYQDWYPCNLTRQLTKINSSARKCVFTQKWVKLTQDEIFSIFKKKHSLRVYLVMANQVTLSENLHYKLQNFFWPTYLRKWLFRLLFVENPLIETSETWGFTPVYIWRWIFRQRIWTNKKYFFDWSIYNGIYWVKSVHFL